MLNKLTIKNIALIDFAEIEFSLGLNVLSGETGAGKSVIIESLNFVLGAKADKAMIRSGETECSVVAEFNVENNLSVYELLDELDFGREDVLIISRKFNVDGKSSIKINGNTSTVGMLKKFTEILVDVHGQSEHFSLLSTQNQLKLIDKFAGTALLAVKDSAKELYEQLKSVNKQLDEFGGDESSRLLRLDVLNYQINEIEQAELLEDEEQKLLELKQKLANFEKISNALTAVKQAISSEGGIDDILSNASRSAFGIINIAPEYQELYNRLESALTDISDISSTADSLISSLDIGDINPDYIENRLELYKKLKKKYGGDYIEIMSFLEQLRAEKEKLENFSELFAELSCKKNDISKKLYSCYEQMSEIRRDAGKEFSNNVTNELKTLGMNSATFSINFENLPDFNDVSFTTYNGIDKIEFRFSANSGEPEKPMSAIISGGEMSRFMLAIKVQTAKYNDISTFIFDEIDAGISGRTASVVAEKFAVISKDVQLISITHLSQISAMADNNLLIVKYEEDGRTHTRVDKLDENGKILEISRLIGGIEGSNSATIHAKNIINNATEFKNSLK